MNSIVSFSLQNEHQCLLYSLKIQCSLKLLAPTNPPLLRTPTSTTLYYSFYKMNSMVSFSLQNEHQCLLHSLKIQCSLQLLVPKGPLLLPPPSILLVEEDTHNNNIA